MTLNSQSPADVTFFHAKQFFLNKRLLQFLFKNLASCSYQVVFTNLVYYLILNILPGTAYSNQISESIVFLQIISHKKVRVSDLCIAGIFLSEEQFNKRRLYGISY